MFAGGKSSKSQSYMFPAILLLRWSKLKPSKTNRRLSTGMTLLDYNDDSSSSSSSNNSSSSSHNNNKNYNDNPISLNFKGRWRPEGINKRHQSKVGTNRPVKRATQPLIPRSWWTTLAPHTLRRNTRPLEAGVHTLCSLSLLSLTQYFFSFFGIISFH